MSEADDLLWAAEQALAPMARAYTELKQITVEDLELAAKAYDALTRREITRDPR